MPSKRKTTVTKKEAKHSLVPKLRFPEFQGAGGWDRVRLGDAADIKTGPFGSTLHQSDYVPNGTPIVTVEHLSEGGLVHRNLPMVSAEDKQRLRSYVLRAGDIVFSRVGSVDRNSLVRDQENGWLFSGRLLRIRTNPKALAPSFLSFYFQLEPTKRKLRSVAVGQTMASVNTEILSDFRILAAPLAEQQKIAECLSSVDEVIAAQARKLDALKTHKRGLMQQLFPREGETQPRLRFPEFQNTGEWAETNLGSYFDPIRNGFVGTATPYYTTSDGVKYLQGRNIKQGRIEADNLIYITNEFHSRQRKSQLNEGDILMVQSGHVGECAVVGSEFAGCNCHALIILSPNRKLSSEFFVHYFYSPIGELSVFQITTGNTIKHILASELKTLPVLVPSLPEQQRIATCLSSLDALIAAETQKQAALQRHKRGLMQQLFPSPESNVMIEDSTT